MAAAAVGGGWTATEGGRTERDGGNSAGGPVGGYHPEPEWGGGGNADGGTASKRGREREEKSHRGDFTGRKAERQGNGLGWFSF